MNFSGGPVRVHVCSWEAWHARERCGHIAGFALDGLGSGYGTTQQVEQKRVWYYQIDVTSDVTCIIYADFSIF